MQTYVDDETGYLSWTQTHPAGFVLNAARTGNAGVFLLHTARCKDITTNKRTHYTGPDYYKLCSETRAALVDWARNQGRALDVCSRCKP